MKKVQQSRKTCTPAMPVKIDRNTEWFIEGCAANEWSCMCLLLDAAIHLSRIESDYARATSRVVGRLMMHHTDAETLRDLENAVMRAEKRGSSRRYERRRRAGWGPNVIDMLDALKAMAAS